MATKHTDHWEALFDSTYFRWFDLAGSPALVRVTGVKRLVEVTMRGGAKKKVSVLHFEQVQGQIVDVKPLVLNRTNAETLSEVLGEYVPAWIGKEVVLIQEQTKLKGKPVPCVRIRAKKEGS